ncbi:MAG TPA: hypothetical protein VN025_07225 [Candidatus Dormibacteraeota bacterium]|jgi:hypothetical protein|nr:hypothetical protein [Candidatus Dormibacteraeota bacterium]
MRTIGKITTAWLLVLVGSAQGGIAAIAEKTTIRGWLADEDCAKNRASGGTYAAPGLTCTRECIAKGKKIAIIDPDGKRVLVIENQDIAKKNVGDYVEINGSVDPKTNLLHADSLKFLDKNRAMCGMSQKKPAVQKNN